MFSVKLEGAREMELALHELGMAARRTLRAALKKAAEPVRDALRDAAPRSDQGSFMGPVKHAADTMMIAAERARGGAASVDLGAGFSLLAGELSGLSLGFGKSSKGDAAVAVGPSKEGFYLFFHEFGTKHMPARPWARPAWERTKFKALDVFQREIWKEIEKTAKRLARQAASTSAPKLPEWKGPTRA